MRTGPWKRGWFSVDQDAPPDECGFTTEYPDFPVLPDEDIRCGRPTWDDSDQCIWHARVDGKPLDALRRANEDRGERLDGAYLAGVAFGDAFEFDGHVLVGASFAGASLGWASLAGSRLRGADFTDAVLVGTDLTGAALHGADLVEAVLRGADLSGAVLNEAELTGADLGGAALVDSSMIEADATGANLGGADLTDAVLRGTDLGQAYLRRANLTDAYLTDVDLTGANLEQATLTRTNLFDANLRGAEFYGAVFDGTRINHGTEFGEHYRDAIDDGDADPTADPSPWNRAEFCHRQIEELTQTRSLSERARRAYRDRKDVRRDELWAKTRRDWEEKGPAEFLADRDSWTNVGRWTRATASERITGYGDNPYRVVRFSAVVIVVWTLLYYLLGRIRIPPAQDGARFVGLELLPSFPLHDTVGDLLVSLYFSVVTFTNLGYGDLQPTGWAQGLATVESFVGALLMALLVFVLGRRTTW